MSQLVFLGDAVTAAGFRLAGLEVFEPSAAEAPTLFERLCGEAQLILLTAEVAAWLPPGRLVEAQLADWPLVLMIADARGRVPVPDRVAALRRQLGLGS